jgi:hypothetical protein
VQQKLDMQQPWEQTWKQTGPQGLSPNEQLDPGMSSIFPHDSLSIYPMVFHDGLVLLPLLWLLLFLLQSQWRRQHPGQAPSGLGAAAGGLEG